MRPCGLTAHLAELVLLGDVDPAEAEVNSDLDRTRAITGLVHSPEAVGRFVLQGLIIDFHDSSLDHETFLCVVDRKAGDTEDLNKETVLVAMDVADLEGAEDRSLSRFTEEAANDSPNSRTALDVEESARWERHNAVPPVYISRKELENPPYHQGW